MFSQLFSGDFSLPGSPSAFNPNKAILTVDHKTREVLCAHEEELDLQYSSKSLPCKCVLSDLFQILSANEQACKLFECTTSDLIGKNLSCILKKTTQVLEEALEQDFPLVDGSVAAVSGKVV